MAYTRTRHNISAEFVLGHKSGAGKGHSLGRLLRWDEAEAALFSMAASLQPQTQPTLVLSVWTRPKRKKIDDAGPPQWRQNGSNRCQSTAARPNNCHPLNMSRRRTANCLLQNANGVQSPANAQGEAEGAVALQAT